MHKKTTRAKQTTKFLKWIRRYPGWWQLICQPGNEHMDMDMLRQMIKRLEKQGFYEIIFAMLEIHKDMECLKEIQEWMMKDFMVAEWGRGNQDQMIGRLVQYLE